MNRRSIFAGIAALTLMAAGCFAQESEAVLRARTEKAQREYQQALQAEIEVLSRLREALFFAGRMYELQFKWGMALARHSRACWQYQYPQSCESLPQLTYMWLTYEVAK